MATSGTYLWSPELAECVDEAFERCRVDPASLAASHMVSARRSINFMLSEWAADENHEFRIERVSIDLVQGTATYTINPASNNRVIDVNQVSLERAGAETTIWPMSRQEYDDIPVKTTQGRPSRYFLDKRQASVTLTLWPVPENSTDDLEIDILRRFQDFGEGSSLEPDIPYYMREAFVAGLASKLAAKFAPEQIIPRLQAAAIMAYRDGVAAQRGDRDVVIVPVSNRATRGRSRYPR